MNKRFLLSGLLIVALLLGFTACKSSLLDEDEKDGEILFQAGAWEFTVTGDGFKDVITCTIPDSEIGSYAPQSSSVLRDIVVNGETVSTLWAYINEIYYRGKQVIEVSINFHRGNNTQDSYFYNLKGTHNKTTASGTGDKNHKLSKAVTFTARKI
jgi:hypothetical protein